MTEQKNVSLLSTIMWPVEESTNLDELLFPWEFPFLDLRSEGLSNLVTLSEPRFARSDNRSTLLDIIPSSLRSRKVKILPRKVKFILVCIPLQAAFCLQEGIYILLPQESLCPVVWLTTHTSVSEKGVFVRMHDFRREW